MRRIRADGPRRAWVNRRRVAGTVSGAAKSRHRSRSTIRAQCAKPPTHSTATCCAIKAASAERWKDELFARGVIDRKAKNPRTDFKRIKDGLADRALIGERDGLVWRAKE